MKPGARHGAASALWVTAAITAFWSFGYALVPAGDLWWHLAAGRWMLAHRALPTRDPFSYTAVDAPWLNHEWLADLIFALWERAFGLESVVYWKWAVLIATFLLLHRSCARLTGERAASYASVVFAAAVASPLLDIRPHLYSLIGLSLVLHATLGRSRPMPWLPVLFLVWANLHAGFVLGLLALATLQLPAIVSTRPPDRRAACALLGTCALATIVNPNGLGPYRYASRYAFDSASPFRGIVEWQSPLSPGALATPLFAYAVGVLIFCVLYGLLDPTLRRERRIAWPALLLSTITLAMALRSARFVPIFAITETLMVAPVLAALLARSGLRMPPLATPALATLGFGSFLLLRHPVGPAAFTDLTMTPTFPVETCDFVSRNALTGNVFAYYGWGGFLQLRTAGRMKVFIDQRADTVYSDEVFIRYRSVTDLAPGWEEIPERSGATYVLWPRAFTPHWEALLASQRWQLLYADLMSVLLVRTDAVPAVPLHPTPDSAYRRLAAGWTLLTRGDAAGAAEEFRAARAHEPALGAACYLTALAEARSSDPKAARLRCDERFPYRDYLSSRLGIRPLPPALASASATSTGDPSAPPGSGSR